MEKIDLALFTGGSKVKPALKVTPEHRSTAQCGIPSLYLTHLTLLSHLTHLIRSPGKAVGTQGNLMMTLAVLGFDPTAF